MTKKTETQSSAEVLTPDKMSKAAQTVVEPIQNKTMDDTPSTQWETVVVMSEQGLNLRSGPSKDYDIRLILPKGTALTVISTPSSAYAPGWLPVLGPCFHLGWVDSRYIEALSPGEEG